MPKRSAGLLVYRLRDGVVEVLIGHPGGPFWARKDDGAWSIPKGEYAEDEDPWAAAQREFSEEIGLAPRGQAGVMARSGYFSPGGTLPINTHGGLLSYGHCGVAGAMAHLAELYDQMAGRAPTPLLKRPTLALLHGDGGVMSSHVSIFVENKG